MGFKYLDHTTTTDLELHLTNKTYKGHNPVFLRQHQYRVCLTRNEFESLTNMYYVYVSVTIRHKDELWKELNMDIHFKKLITMVSLFKAANRNEFSIIEIKYLNRRNELVLFVANPNIVSSYMQKSR